MDTATTFISSEKLGVFAAVVEEGIKQQTKKLRAKALREAFHVLQKMKLVPHEEGYVPYSISVGTDASGNYGFFVVEEKVITSG